MLFTAPLVCALALAALTDAQQITLGSAAPFGIVATTAITSTGLSVVTGELGISPNTASSITGFPPGVSGAVHGGDAVAAAAHADAQTAYSALAALTPTKSLTGTDLGGQILGPGVYNFASSGGLTGILTLDGQGNPNAVFVFQFGSTLTTATASSVVLINGAQACNVYFQVGSSATLGTATQFIGNILASASITVNSAVSVQGGLYALTAAVTLIDDAITALTNCNGVIAPVSTSTSTSMAPSSTPTSIMTSMVPTATAATTITLTSTITVTLSGSPGSTTTVTDTVTGPGSTTTVTKTVATSYTTSTSTTTSWGTHTATKTGKTPSCPTSTANANNNDKRDAKKTSTVWKTVTSTEKGDKEGQTKTVHPNKADKTHTVETTCTSTHTTHKTVSSMYTSTVTPACTAKAQNNRRYQRM